MTWSKSRADRERDAEVYGSPEYKRNRALALRRAGGQCEATVDGRRCGSRDRVQCDHVIPVAKGGTHHPENLRVLCARCHRAKTAQEGGGYRARGPRARDADPPAQPRTQW